MNNLFKRLKGRKGFTLLECIIAIAVFAALTLVVMAMLTYARNEAVNANQTEEDLTKLIENVISDDTQKKYNGDSEVLHLTVGSEADTFDISYNVIDGYKNFVVCPVCGEHADNTVFMGVTKQEDFIQTTQYVCPKDESHVFVTTLRCEECGSTGTHTDTTAYQYIPSTGGYYCLACGSSNVRDPASVEKVISEEKLSVNGLVANAVVYGKVEPNDPADASAYQKLVSFSNIAYDGTNARQETTVDAANQVGGVVTITSIEYTAPRDQIVPGTYTMTVQRTTPSAMLTDNCVTIQLPPYYRINVLKETTGDTSGVKHVLSSDPDDAPIGKNGWLKLDFTKGVTSITVDFQLTNYKSGYSFDFDYNSDDALAQSSTLNDHGLIGYWFGQQAQIQGSYTGDSVYPTSIRSSSAFSITKTE